MPIPMPPEMSNKLRRQVREMSDYATGMLAQFDHLCDEAGANTDATGPGDALAAEIIRELQADGHREKMAEIANELAAVSESLSVEHLTLEDALTIVPQLQAVDNKVVEVQAIFPKLLQRLYDYKQRN